MAASTFVVNPGNRTISGAAFVPESFRVNMVLQQTKMKRLNIQKQMGGIMYPPVPSIQNKTLD